MPNILIVPDSFKGTLSSVKVANVIRSGILSVLPSANITTLPIADGGEGTVDVFLSSDKNAKKIMCRVTGANGNQVNTYYALLHDNSVVIDVASASGLMLMGNSPNVMKATTLGTGEMILHALGKGYRTFYIGLGGSATNDGAIGALTALGIRFKDIEGKDVPPNGEGLTRTASVDVRGKDIRLDASAFTLITDVRNPLYGANGASRVFAKQKGACNDEMQKLDVALQKFSVLIQNTCSIDVSKIHGAGAAGGFGAGAMAFLNAKSVSGISFMLNYSGFEKFAKQADFIITGEGRLDSQTKQGKVPYGIAQRSGNIPVLALCGMTTLSKQQIKELGFALVLETNAKHKAFDEICGSAKKDLFTTAKQAGKWIERHFASSKKL